MKLASLIIFSPFIVVLAGLLWPLLVALWLMKRINDPVLALMSFVMALIAQVSYLMFLISIVQGLQELL